MFPHKFYETGAKKCFFHFYAPYSLVSGNSRKTMFFVLISPEKMEKCTIF